MPRSNRTARNWLISARALADQSVPGTVERLHVELLLALQLDKPHGRSRGRLSDRLGVAVVVLAGFHVRANILGRHQPNLMALGAQDAAEVVSAAAGLHRHNARGQADHELDHALPAQASAQDDTPGTVQTHHAAAVLAEINSKHRDLHGPLLPFGCSASLKLPDERGGPSHKSLRG